MNFLNNKGNSMEEVSKSWNRKLLVDPLEIKYEIALLRFQTRGLTTDSLECREAQQQIIELLSKANSH